MPTNEAFNGHTHNIIPNIEADTTSLISSSSSFSSSHSFMSFPENISSPSPSSSSSTPTTPLRLTGVPFSWEKLPGIPKHQIQNKNDHHHHFLPLPPAGTPRKSGLKENPLSGKKLISGDSFRKDPFFAAFVECSKDEDDTISSFWKGSSVGRSFSDRLGFVNIYTSCKNASAVSDSIVYLPRSNRRSHSGQLR